MKGVVTDSVQLACGVVKYCVTESNFASECASRWGVALENYSKFGSTVRHAHKALDRYLSRVERGDVVVLEYGGNDCNFDWEAISCAPEEKHSPQVSLPDFVAVYNQVIDRVKGVGALPVMLSRPPLVPKLFFENISRGRNAGNILRWMDGDVNFIGYWQEYYNLEIFKIGALRGVRVLDISSAFLHDPHMCRLMCVDGMHPNEQGHRLIASTIMSEVGNL